MNRKHILFVLFLSTLSLACESKQKDNVITVNQNEESKEAVNIYDVPLDTAFEDETINHEPKEGNIYTLDRLKDEFKEAFNLDLPIGTYFWDEFEDIELQYGLSEDESKLLGMWMNVDSWTTFPNSPIVTGRYYNYYNFFPNKLFLLQFKFENYYMGSNNKLSLRNALGTWEIVNSIVQITIYAIITAYETEYEVGNYPYIKNVLFVERPYTVDFINIDDIGEEGFTKRPINDTILSNDLQQKVRIKEPNMTNNLYVRNVYSLHVMNSIEPKKYYGNFSTVREMAQENLSGLDIVTNRELIEKYIFNLWL
jgi:hypothetical protein